MKAKVTVQGGAGQIGGNKILVEDGDARIWLDMGSPFSLGEKFFVEYLVPRDRFGLRDYFALDLVPKIPGLFSEEALEPTEYPYKRPDYSGILISHVHFDHSAHLSFVDSTIPVHIGEGTLNILKSWEETSARVNLGVHDYRTFRSGKKLKLDGVEATPVHVDHSVPAAYGYIMHCPSGTVVYTGDLRRHGPHYELTDDFIEAAKKARPDLLICEGTRIDPNDKRAPYSEKDVKKLSIEVVKKAKGKLAIVTFYPRDVDRMRTFYEVAKECGRKFVMSVKTAFLLLAIERDKHISVPKVAKENDILVYFREMRRSEKPWEREVREIVGDRAVGSDYVARHKGDSILQLDFEHFTELIDINPKKGSVFIHSKSEPFEEDDVTEEVKNNWLEYFGLVEHQLHASGHLSRSELEDLVSEVKPKRIMPIHTEHPEMFKDFAKEVVIPETGRTLSF